MGKVWVETVGDDGRGRRKRLLDSEQLHGSPVNAAGQPRSSGYIRLHPGQHVPAPRADDDAPGRTSEAGPGGAAAAGLRLALDDAARSLRTLGLSMDGPATWAPADSAAQWALRAGELYETLTLLVARIEPYAEEPGAAAGRVRAAAAAHADQGLEGPAGR
ncbi:hypothetical protein ACH4U5_31460 [Streptomyces sp. NPDC020858]|uniref:hypothetical protein n=1 Tax=Streptomyces sp. NPDC020858 TaxID=3365097 RepID=UPI0037A2CFBE